jgi:hypothetical protein
LPFLEKGWGPLITVNPIDVILECQEQSEQAWIVKSFKNQLATLTILKYSLKNHQKDTIFFIKRLESSFKNLVKQAELSWFTQDFSLEDIRAGYVILEKLDFFNQAFLKSPSEEYCWSAWLSYSSSELDIAKFLCDTKNPFIFKRLWHTLRTAQSNKRPLCFKALSQIERRELLTRLMSDDCFDPMYPVALEAPGSNYPLISQESNLLTYILQQFDLDLLVGLKRAVERYKVLCSDEHFIEIQKSFLFFVSAILPLYYWEIAVDLKKYYRFYSEISNLEMMTLRLASSESFCFLYFCLPNFQPFSLLVTDMKGYQDGSNVINQASYEAKLLQEIRIFRKKDTIKILLNELKKRRFLGAHVSFGFGSNDNEIRYCFICDIMKESLLADFLINFYVESKIFRPDFEAVEASLFLTIVLSLIESFSEELFESRAQREAIYYEIEPAMIKVIIKIILTGGVALSKIKDIVETMIGLRISLPADIHEIAPIFFRLLDDFLIENRAYSHKRVALQTKIQHIFDTIPQLHREYAGPTLLSPDRAEPLLLSHTVPQKELSNQRSYDA